MSFRFHLVGALSAAFILLISCFVPPAGAATISGAITSISTTKKTVGQWDEITFDCTWAVPNGSRAGDTFTLQLPSQLRWQGPLDFALTDPAGHVVATAHANAAGLVVFTLTSFVTTHPYNLHGTCNFTTQYTAVQTKPGPETLVFTVGAETITVPIEDTGPCISACGPVTTARKDMWWTNTSQTTLQALIRTPATTQPTNTIEITDTPGPGIQLDCTTARGEVGKQLDALGRLVAPFDSGMYPASISCTGSSATAKWTGLPAGEHAEFWVQATVVDPALATFRNNGLVVMNGYPTPVWATLIHSTASGSGNGTSKPQTATSVPPSPVVTVNVPPAPSNHPAPNIVATAATAPALAQTGSGANTGVLIGVALIVLGGLAVVLTMPRRRQH